MQKLMSPTNLSPLHIAHSQIPTNPAAPETTILAWDCEVEKTDDRLLSKPDKIIVTDDFWGKASIKPHPQDETRPRHTHIWKPGKSRGRWRRGYMCDADQGNLINFFNRAGNLKNGGFKVVKGNFDITKLKQVGPHLIYNPKNVTHLVMDIDISGVPAPQNRWTDGNGALQMSPVTGHDGYTQMAFIGLRTAFADRPTHELNA